MHNNIARRESYFNLDGFSFQNNPRYITKKLVTYLNETLCSEVIFMLLNTLNWDLSLFSQHLSKQAVQQCGISILASAALLVSLYEHLFSGVQ